MKYYAIQFPNSTTLILSSPYPAKDVIDQISFFKCIKSNDNTFYNIKLYQSFHEIIAPDDRQKKSALTFKDLI